MTSSPPLADDSRSAGSPSVLSVARAPVYYQPLTSAAAVGGWFAWAPAQAGPPFSRSSPRRPSSAAVCTARRSQSQRWPPPRCAPRPPPPRRGTGAYPPDELLAQRPSRVPGGQKRLPHVVTSRLAAAATRTPYREPGSMCPQPTHRAIRCMRRRGRAHSLSMFGIDMLLLNLSATAVKIVVRGSTPLLCYSMDLRGDRGWEAATAASAGRRAVGQIVLRDEGTPSPLDGVMQPQTGPARHSVRSAIPRAEQHDGRKPVNARQHVRRADPSRQLHRT